MPCYDAGDDPSSETYKRENRRINFQKYGVLTVNIEGEVACAAMKAFEAGAVPPDFCIKWYEEHKRKDSARPSV